MSTGSPMLCRQVNSLLRHMEERRWPGVVLTRTFGKCHPNAIAVSMDLFRYFTVILLWVHEKNISFVAYNFSIKQA